MVTLKFKLSVLEFCETGLEFAAAMEKAMRLAGDKTCKSVSMICETTGNEIAFKESANA